MMEDFIECACQKIKGKNFSLHDFQNVRNKCPAIKNILIPDSKWEDFYRIANEKPDEALHQFVIIEAFFDGYLSKITSHIHRFLMNGENPNKNLKYKNNLFETWLMKESIEERHKTFKTNYGILMELLIAEFLFTNGWKICNLEALGAVADIIGISPTKKKYCIEVKYIGQENEDFALVVKSICGERSGGAIDYHSAINYLMFITYTAAKQLENVHEPKIAIIVVSNMNWNNLKEHLQENFNWNSPQFLKSDKWDKYLPTVKIKYPNIEAEMKPIFNSLSELWIIKEENFMEFSLFKSIKFNE
ncbi:MAG: hypothetical protein ACFFDN_21915 [Candidatus Hodarchaeota archaeon]